MLNVSDLDISCLQLFLFISMPYKYNANLLNYLITLVIEAISGSMCCIILATVCSFFFATCWYVMASFSDLSTMFFKINDSFSSETTSNDIKLNVEKYLIEIIKFHGDIIKLVQVKIFIFITLNDEVAYLLCKKPKHVRLFVEINRLLDHRVIDLTTIFFFMTKFNERFC